jgi:transposase
VGRRWKHGMEYSPRFRERMVRRMLGPSGMSANALSAEVDVGQPTLSRWLREARSVEGMGREKTRRREKAGEAVAGSRRAQDRTAEQKLRAIAEASALGEQDLGAWLRGEGLHAADLERWRGEALEGLKGPAAKRTRGRTVEARRIRELEKELRRKEKALAETAALLVLKKKMEAFWGDDEDESTRSRKG